MVCMVCSAIDGLRFWNHSAFGIEVADVAEVKRTRIQLIPPQIIGHLAKALKPEAFRPPRLLYWINKKLLGGPVARRSL